jgi:acyl-CoA synthetase (AMP-forming)/AMP-acid ligase II
LSKQLHDIIDIQVVGVSDEKYGEEIAAVIKVKNLS